MARDGYVDERIVEMQFDNDQFEREAKNSMNTIEKLKQSLKFDGVEQGIDQIEKSVKGLDFSSITEGVSSIADRFSVLGVAADQVIRRITNGVIDLGLQAVSTAKSMSSLANMAAGWNQYAQITTATQRIAANLKEGETMEDVNKVVDILKWLSDETSFRMNSMVDNIGKFTATGQSLEDSADAIMGIALAAGLAGTNTSMLEHAYTGFAKAMAQGYMTSGSWQWIQTAGMNTEEVYKQLILAGEATGQLKRISDDTWKTLKGNVVTVGNVVSTFADKWLTSDTIMEFAKKFNGAVHSIYEEWDKTGETTSSIIARMYNELDPLAIKALQFSQEAKTFPEVIESVKTAVSGGWATTFQYIFGNYEEAKVLWTDLANSLWDIFASSGVARNNILKTWYDLGGRTDMLKGVYDIFESIVSIADDVKTRFMGDIFGVKTFDQLKESLYDTNDEAADLIDRYEEIDKMLGLIHDGVIKFSPETVEAYEAELEEIEDSLRNMDKGQYLVNLTKKFKDFGNTVKGFADVDETLFNLRKKLKALQEDAASPIMDAERRRNIDEAIKKTEQQISMYEQGQAVFDALYKTFEILAGMFQVVKIAIGGVKNLLIPIFTNLFRLIEPISALVKAFAELGKAVFDYLGFNKSLKKELRSVRDVVDENFGKVIDWLIEKIGKLTEWVRKLTKEIQDGTSPIAKFFDLLKTQFDSFKKWLGDATEGIGEDGGLVQSIGGFLGRTLEILLGIFSKTGPLVDRIINTLQQLWDFVAPIAGQVFEKLGEYLKNFADSISKEGDIIGAISRLADIFVGVRTAFSVDWIAEYLASLGGIADAAGAIYQKFRGTYFIDMAKSLLILAAALLVLSFIDPDKLIIGTAVIEVLMKSIAKMVNNMSALSSSGGTPQGIMAMFNPSMATKMLKSAFAYIEVAAAMLILAIAVKKIASLDTDKLILGVIAIGLMMQELGAFAKHTAGLKKINTKGFISIAASLVIMAQAIKMIGKLDPGEATQGLLIVGLLMTFLALFLKFLQTESKLLGKTEHQANGGSIALAVIGIATSMVILAAAIKMLGQLKPDEMSQGLMGVIVLLLALVAALKLLEGMGLGAVGIGASFMMIAAALTALAGIAMILGVVPWQKALQGVGAIAALMTILTVSLKVLAKDSALKLIGIAGALVIMSTALTILTVPLMLLSSIGIWGVIAGLIGFAGALALMWAAGKFLGEMTGTLLKLSGAMALFGIGVLAVGAGVTMLAVALTSSVTSIVASLTILAGGIGSILAALIGGLAAAATTLVSGLLKIGLALIDGIKALVPSLIELVMTTLVQLVDAISGRGMYIIQAILTIFYNIVDVLYTEAPKIADAGLKLVIYIMNGLAVAIMENSDKLIAAIENIVISVVYFIMAALEEILGTFGSLGKKLAGYVGTAKENLKDAMKDIEIEKVGSDAANEMASGFKEGSSTVSEEAAKIPTGALERLAGSDGLFKEKGFGFGQEIKDGLTESAGDIPNVFEEALAGTGEALNAEGATWGTELVSGLQGTIEGGGEGEEGGTSLVSVAEQIPQTALDKFEEKTPEFEESGKEWDTALKDGIKREKDNVVKEAQGVADKSHEPVDKAKSDWTTAGENMSLGAASGIIAKKGDVINAAIEVADAATAAFNEHLKIMSPSRVWEESGAFMTLGAAKGMMKAIPAIIDSAISVGDYATAAFEDNGIYIRPVVDLTNISGTASSIDSMLNSQRAAAVAASVDINSQVTQIDQLVDVTNRILGSIQNGSDLYLDDSILAGRINRRLGVL